MSPRSIRSVLTIAVTALVALAAFAQPMAAPSAALSMRTAALASAWAGAMPPPAAPELLDIPAEPIVAGADVGYLPGQWSVDDTGAFVYTIPIDVPNGHLAPSIALTYSSANRSNSELGVGWRLRAASVITRCGRNLTVDGTVAADGRFCMDASKLIAVPAATGQAIGAYGAPGTQYRTERDIYARITTTGGVAGAPEKFRVELRSGVVREYRAVMAPQQAGSLSSAIAPPAGAPGGAPLGDAVTDYLVGPSVADRWLLDTETDASGNQLRYDWLDSIDPVTHGLDLRLLQIRYGRVDSSLEFRKVAFEYEDRPDHDSVAWARGVRSELHQRLQRIVAYAPSPRSMVPVWRYTLEYRAAPSRNGRSLLATVQKCGLAGAATAGDGREPSAGGCLWKKTFAWGDDAPGASARPVFATRTVKTFADPLVWPVFDAADPSSWANQITALVHPPVAHVLDLDGDGTDDLVLQASAGVDGLPTHIFRGERHADGTATALAQYRFFDGAMQPGGRRDRVLLQTARAVDLDNSGRERLLAVRQLQNLDPSGNPGQGWTYEYKLFGWGANGFGPDDQAALLDVDHLSPKRFDFLDLDGDRRLDMLVEGEGAEQGDGPGFFWWNKNWQVWRNLGGALQKTASVPLETKCPSQITDADGDGRAELAQLYDHDEVVGKHVLDASGNPTSIPWAAPHYGADAESPGYRQYECTAIGYLTLDAAGQPLVTKSASPLSSPIGGPAAARANAAAYGRHQSPHYVFGDFNGDGLEDEFTTQLDDAGQGLRAWLRWNTGRGYGPRVAVSDFFPAGLDATWQVRHLVGDLDGDGDDDLVSLRRPDASGQGALILALSDGHGGFEQDALPGGPGLFEALETYVTTRLSDFDGDGRPDLVGFIDPQTLVVRVQQPDYDERVASVSDEPTPWPRVGVVYGNQASDKPEPVAACAYPLACVRGGATVVRRVLSREHLVDPTAADLTDANARTIHYSYEDPVMHLRGRGLLGYRKVRRWDPARPLETVTEYDNRSEVGNGYFPGVSMPIRVTTVVPFATIGGGEVAPGTSGPTRPARMMARVTRVQSAPQVQPLNRALSGDAWGLTYDVHAGESVTEEWEQAVDIDWSTATSEHLSSADPSMKRLYGDEAPAQVLRTTVDTAVHDDYGNETQRRVEVLGAGSEQTDRQFTNVTQPAWRIAQLYHETVTRSDGKTSVANDSEYYYDALGRLTDAFRDKGQADPALPAATHLSYDERGNVIAVQLSARNHAGDLETRETRIEYAPPRSGWADEKLYPSQIWSPGVAGYQPSTWLAVQPAYGVTVAMMSANGVQVRTRYDDLGRPLWTKRDGHAAGSLSYAGRADSGGYNGVIVGSTIQNPAGPAQTARVELDGLGRTLREIDQAFDGASRVIEDRYDALGRLAARSRPFTEGAIPGPFTTFSFDALDRPLKTTAPDGSVIDNTYPTAFQSRTTDANQQQSLTVRDLLGRTVRTANLLAGKEIATTYEYGPHGLENSIDPAGHVTHVEYNALGWPVLQDTPDTGRTLSTYTGFGEVHLSQHVKTGETLAREFDALGRLTRQTGPDGVAQFTYDTAAHGLGELAQAQSPDKVVTNLSYDANGRVEATTQVIDGQTDRIAFGFDADSGQLLRIDYPSVDATPTPGLSVTYGYRASGFAQTVRTQVPGGNPRTLWNVVERDLDDNLLAATQGWNDALTLQRHYQTSTGRMDAMNVLQGNQALLNLSYGFLPNGLVKSREDKVMQRQERFAYDELSRLVQAGLTYAGVVHETHYDYDATGNLLRVDGAQHLIGQQTPPLANLELNLYGTLDPTFPQPHTLTSHTENGTTQTYAYDARGRRKSGGGLDIPLFNAVDLPKTVVKNGQSWQYLYDAFGNKVKETSPDAAATVYVGDLYERRTAPGQQTAHVFHVEGTDGAVADIVHTASQPYMPHYLLEDALGSASVVVDGAGGVERRHFDPFGKRVNPDGSAYAGPAGIVTTGFTGHEHEAALGLINMRGRLYDPALKRFLSADPYVAHPQFGQSWNPYSYVLNSPLNFTDPTGYRDEAELCTNLADQSVCYPNSASGSPAPGTDDFDACRDCDKNGSASEPYGDDLNGQPIGPGFVARFDPSTLAGADGRPGRRTPQSSNSGYTSAGRVGAAHADVLEHLDRNENQASGGASGAPGAMFGYQIATPLSTPVKSPIPQISSKKWNAYVRGQGQYWNSHFSRLLGRRSPYAYAQGSKQDKMRWIADQLLDPVSWETWKNFKLGSSHYFKPWTIIKDGRKQIHSWALLTTWITEITLDTRIHSADLWLRAANSVLNGEFTADDWGFRSIQAKKFLETARTKGAGSREAAMQAAALGLTSELPDSPDAYLEIKPNPWF